MQRRGEVFASALVYKGVTGGRGQKYSKKKFCPLLALRFGEASHHFQMGRDPGLLHVI